MTPRLKKFVSTFRNHKIDAYLITSDVNIQYLTNFPACESWLLVFPKQSYYITDARYTLEAKKGLKGISVKQYNQSIFAMFASLINEKKAMRVGFDERLISVSLFKQLKRNCPKGVKLVPKNGLIEEFRIIKDSGEVSAIRKCLKLHHEANAFLKRIVKPGLTEKEIFLRLEHFVKSKDALFSFDPIVASGPNSCFPHAKITNRKVRNHEPVLIDMGIDIGGYKSDLTRMFFLGKISPLVSKVNKMVDAAQKEAIKNIRPGAKTSDIDAFARNYLQKNKLAKYFGHSLGHGVGLEIHEEPRLSQKSNAILQEGMVVTVEPAVYIPNKFGIRIEDMVLITKRGCEVLSKQF